VRRVCTAAVVGTTTTASEVTFIIGRVVGASIYSSSSSRSLRVAWRRLWSSIGGVMAAKAAQERGGLRQAAQPAGAGAPGRMRRAF